MRRLNELLVLVKIRVVLLTTLSAATGFVLAEKQIPADLPLFCAAFSFLAAGASALNQYQERRSDRAMARTKQRPLAAGKIAAGTGLFIALLFIFSGLLSLYFFFGLLPAALGLLCLVLYNAVYTYLKRVTAFAALPGALVGALPPLMGWTAAGGALNSPALPALMLFFFLWQVAHSWLLVGIHHNDYAKAGFPSLGHLFSNKQLARIIFSWLLAAACAAMLLPLFVAFHHPLTLFLLLGACIALAIVSLPLVKRGRFSAPILRRTFASINLFALAMMALLIIDQGVFLNSPSMIEKGRAALRAQPVDLPFVAEREDEGSPINIYNDRGEGEPFLRAQPVGPPFVAKREDEGSPKDHL